MSVADAAALVKRLVILTCVLGVMWLGVWIAPAFGQEQHPPTRPKVGLVLSGGGAMGMAHVGAIQTLETLGIRPDLVVGTSMGSIVGGLYASGMSGAELEHAIETMNWDLIFGRRWCSTAANWPGRCGLRCRCRGCSPPTA